jgi:glutamate-1-semialdehyde 2,1-aminomutase
MTIITPTSIDDLVRVEEQRFIDRMPRSAKMAERAVGSMAGGLTSSWANTRPIPVWVERGEGGHLWDVDGNEYVDYHGGYGVNVVGHANPRVVAAVQRRVAQGTHFAQPTEDAMIVAEELVRRFGLPLWRFNNSGTEATMDAIHLMRAVTGRDLIIKVEGTYHGHHDSVVVSIFRNLDDLGPADEPWRIPGGGVPQSVAELVRIVPYNDLAALERVFEQHPGKIAGMIIEPMMMNAGIITPIAGYLEGIREITRRHGALLAFDEVKTGLVVHPGGATKLFGVQPDIVCLAKALGGGVPCGAVGGTLEVMSAIVDGRYDQVGTFNGNPLTMAAARAVLTEVLTEDAYARANELGTYILDTALAILAEHGQPAYGYSNGFKVSVVFDGHRATNYREFLAINTAVSHLHFLTQFNRGVFLPPWGKSESLTLAVSHTKADADLYLANLATVVEQLMPLQSRASEMFAVGSLT